MDKTRIMIIALIGSHGTGKTTVSEAIKSNHPEFLYFTEVVRKQIPAFGYKTPYEIVDDVGIGVFEVMMINSWSVIDPKVNTVLDTNKIIITDRSAVDNYAYYLTLRKKEIDGKLDTLVKRMAQHYTSLVNQFIFFPIGIFPLVPDEMRPADITYQENMHENIKQALLDLGVPNEKIYHLQTSEVTNRIKEVISLIK